MKQKFILLLILILSINNSYSQFNKRNKDCPIDHRCYLTSNIDEFEEVKTYQINFETFLSGRPKLTYNLARISKDGLNRYFMTFVQPVEGCRTKDSYVYIMFENGNKVKIPNAYTEIDCGTSFIIVDITDYLEEFKTNTITKIRVNIEYTLDFDINKPLYENFSKNLTCISTAI
ncbi:hypothetical protein [Tenacibaculum sp.]|uniref:hypothetical protein n=1 Tax=Tenacibaculum sp. TaxID=1906242 RepID=UPI003D14A08D